MRKAGYGPDNPLKIQVSTRNISYYRDPAVLLIDQLKQIYIDADLDPLELTELDLPLDWTEQRRLLAS